MSKLYKMTGIDDDGEIVDAIGIASVLWLVAMDWFYRGVVMINMGIYFRR